MSTCHSDTSSSRNSNDSEVSSDSDTNSHTDVVLDDNTDETTDKKTVQKCYMGDIQVTNPSGNLHLGSQITFNGPVYIKNLTRDDIISINENCNCENKKYKRHLTNKRIGGRLNKNRLEKSIKNRFFYRFSVKEFALFYVIVTFIYISLLFCHFKIYRSTKNYKIDANQYPGIKLSVITEMNEHFMKFVSRKTWMSDTEMYNGFRGKKINESLTGNCTFDCNINVKSKIRFIILKDFWFSCDGNELCTAFFAEETRRNINVSPIPFYDLYFHYIIGTNGKLYEGRSFTCRFDESFLSKDHLSMITIGIPFCFFDISTIYAYKEKIISVANELLNKLTGTGILMKNYTLEFPKICKNIFESLNKSIGKPESEVLFHENDFFNTSSRSNSTTISKLLFSSRGAIGTDFKNMTSLNLSSPLPDLYYCEHYKGVVRHPAGMIKIRFILKYDDYSKNNSRNVSCYDDETCGRFLNSLINETRRLSSYPINYVIFLPNIVYKIIPLVCDPEIVSDDDERIRKNGFVINILLIDFQRNSLPYEMTNNSDEFIKSFSGLIERITQDISEKIFFWRFSMEFVCETMVHSENQLMYHGSFLAFDNLIKLYKLLKKFKIGPSIKFNEYNDWYTCLELF